MFDDLKSKMDKTMAALNSDYQALRAGRANPALLDRVTVDYYGVPTPVAQVGTVSVPDARTLFIQPWDSSILHDLEKAILKSDIGITPNNDGKAIRLNFPPLTEERRKDLVKMVSKRAEDSKVSIRGIRRDAIDHIKAQKKSGEITEDDLKDFEKEIQTITDNYIKDIDSVSVKKEKEIMEV